MFGRLPLASSISCLGFTFDPFAGQSPFLHHRLPLMEKVIEFPCNAQQYKWIVLTISWIFLKCLYMDVLPRCFLVLMFIGPWYQGPFPEQWSPYGQASLRVSIFGSGNLPPATSSPPEEFQDENDLPKVSRHSFYWKIQIRFYVRPCTWVLPFFVILGCMDKEWSVLYTYWRIWRREWLWSLYWRRTISSRQCQRH